jgi:hypothetical protein
VVELELIGVELKSSGGNTKVLNTKAFFWAKWAGQGLWHFGDAVPEYAPHQTNPNVIAFVCNHS